MASGYGKKSLGQKFKNAAKKALLTLAFAGDAATPVWYEYGTVQERDVKITSVDKNITGYNTDYSNSDPDDEFYSYSPPTITPVYQVTGYETNIGPLKNENTKLHFKTNADDIEKTLQEGKTYRIRFYGKKFTSKLTPNILAAREITDNELKARAEQKKIDNAKQKKMQPAKAPASNTPNAGSPAAQQCANGEVTVIEQVVNGSRVQIVVPIEAAGKVSVTSVQSLTPKPPTP